MECLKDFDKASNFVYFYPHNNLPIVIKKYNKKVIKFVKNNKKKLRNS